MDEASLMALWSKYATITSRFEPTKRWEEACLIFSLIQAKHLKNQLFNYCWQKEKKAARPKRENRTHSLPGTAFRLERETPPPKNPCRVLKFTPGERDDD